MFSALNKNYPCCIVVFVGQAAALTTALRQLMLQFQKTRLMHVDVELNILYGEAKSN